METGDRWRLGRRPALDGLRGIAVLLVIAYHAHIPPFVGGGSVGVLVFFTLSGFLITSPLLEERNRAGRVDLGRFYWKRALRLLPAVAVYVSAMMAASAVFGRQVADPRDLPKILLFVYNWPAASGHPPAIGTAHLWSLSVEEQFYLVWPVLLLVGLRYLSARLVLALTLLAACGSMVARIHFWDGTAAAPWRVYYGSDTRMDALLIGCALALVAARRGLPKASAPLATASFAAILAASTLDGAVRLVLVPTLVPTLTVALIAYGSTARWLTPGWLTLVGRRSYGLYLWHVPPVVLILPHLPVSPWIGVPAAFATAWCLALLSWRFVERPFLRLKDRRPADSTPAATATAVPGPRQLKAAPRRRLACREVFCTARGTPPMP